MRSYSELYKKNYLKLKHTYIYIYFSETILHHLTKECIVLLEDAVSFVELGIEKCGRNSA